MTELHIRLGEYSKLFSQWKLTHQGISPSELFIRYLKADEYDIIWATRFLEQHEHNLKAMKQGVTAFEVQMTSEQYQDKVELATRITELYNLLGKQYALELRIATLKVRAGNI
jgi:hypothetical protein